MNDESVKLSLLNQFKKHQSPIHWLMMENGVSATFYAPFKKFDITALGQDMIVTTIDDKKSQFGVLFTSKNSVPLHRLSKIGFEKIEHRYVYESYELRPPLLVFNVNIVELLQHGWEFEYKDKKNPKKTILCTFDFDTMKIKADTHSSIQDFFKEVNELYLSSQTNAYRSVGIDENNMFKVLGAMSRQQVPVEFTKWFVDNYRNSYNSINESGLIKFIIKLNDKISKAT